MLTKSKTKVREIFLNEEAQIIIKDLEKTYKKYGVKFDNGSYIFLNYEGEQITTFANSFKQLMLATSLKNEVGKNKLTQYSFRHYFITKAIKSKIPLTSIAMQCGNSVEMIQEFYNHLSIHNVKDDFKKM